MVEADTEAISHDQAAFLFPCRNFQESQGERRSVLMLLLDATESRVGFRTDCEIQICQLMVSVPEILSGLSGIVLISMVACSFFFFSL